MTEWQVAGIMAYLLIGLFLADILAVRVDNFYWSILFLWPIMVVFSIFLILVLWFLSLIIRIKNYEYRI